jgi:hypothetical protein
MSIHVDADADAAAMVMLMLWVMAAPMHRSGGNLTT